MNPSDPSKADTEPKFAFGRTVHGFCPLRGYTWPDRCVCCNGPASTKHKELFMLDLRPFIEVFGKEAAELFVRRLTTGVPGIELGMVDKDVHVDVHLPYCPRCKRHETLAGASVAFLAVGGSAIVLAGLLIAVVWLFTRNAPGGSGFPSLSVFLVAFAFSVVGGAVGYALRVAGDKGRGDTCAPIGQTITLEPSKSLFAPGSSLFGWVHFGNAEYGDAFERANGSESAAERLPQGPGVPAATAAPDQGAVSAGLFFNVGKAGFQAGRWDEARMALEEAVSRAPDSAAARFLLGASLAELGRTEAALPHLEASVELDARNANAFNTLGMVLGRLGRTEEADRHLAKAAFFGHSQAAQTVANMGLGFCPRCGALLAAPGQVCAACPDRA